MLYTLQLQFNISFSSESYNKYFSYEMTAIKGNVLIILTHISLFMGHRLTAKNQTRFSTVCLQNALLEFA